MPKLIVVGKIEIPLGRFPLFAVAVFICRSVNSHFSALGFLKFSLFTEHHCLEIHAILSLFGLVRKYSSPIDTPPRYFLLNSIQQTEQVSLLLTIELSIDRTCTSVK